MADEDLRPYVSGTEGRRDVDGNVWFACDPYPTWYRLDGKLLIVPIDRTLVWAEADD